MKNFSSYFDMQYKKTFMRKLDPRIKILISILLMFSFFYSNNYFSILLIIFFSFSLVVCSKISYKKFFKMFIPIIIVTFIPMLLNFMYITSNSDIVTFYFIHINKNNIKNIIFSVSKIFSLYCLSMSMMYTTSFNDISLAIEYFMIPLKKFNIDVQGFSMTIALTLRLLVIVLDQIDKIIKAQCARGLNINSKNFLNMVKSIMSISKSVFISSYNKAYDLAIAMEARCYNVCGVEKKIKYLKLNFVDFLCIGLCIMLYCGVLFLNEL